MEDSSYPKENRQRRTDASRAVPESEAKSKSQSREFRRRSRLHSYSLQKKRMRSESRRTTLEKTLEEQGTLSQAVVRIDNEAARDQEGNGDAGGSRTPLSEGDQQSEISQALRQC